MKLRNYFWVFCVFALPVLLVGSCSTDGDDGNGGTGSQVAALSVQMSPNRNFNNGPISITLATTTPDAAIYYTLNGSVPTATNGTRYTESFNLTADNTSDMPYRGYVDLRAIGIKENHTNSAMARQIFQIFPSEPIKNSSGEPVDGGPETGTGSGYSNAPITVTLSLVDGYITDVSLVGGGQTAGYWGGAKDYAEKFFAAMNSWDFVPAVSGASFSGKGIKDAAKDAIDKILEE
jgi:hypothetical protein